MSAAGSHTTPVRRTTRTRHPLTRVAAGVLALTLAAGTATACSGGPGDEPIVFSGSGEATGD